MLNICFITKDNMSSGIGGGSTTTDREQIEHLQSDREQRRLAEKGNSKYIFTIPRAILPIAQTLTL